KGEGIYYALLCLFYTILHKCRYIYSRSPLSFGLIAFFTRKQLILESHDLAEFQFRWRKALFQWAINKDHFLKLVVITERLKQDFEGAFKKLSSTGKLIVLPDCATKRELDKRIQINLKGNHELNIGYVGSLFKGKGVEMVLPLARKLPEYGFHIV